METTLGIKRLARYSDGPELYSISPTTFRRTAIAAGAVIKLNQTARVDLSVFDAYLSDLKSKSTDSHKWIAKKNPPNFKSEFFKNKKLISTKEGAQIYSMSESKFRREAYHANAFVKIGALARVDTLLFERYIEESRITDPSYYRTC